MKLCLFPRSLVSLSSRYSLYSLYFLYFLVISLSCFPPQALAQKQQLDQQSHQRSQKSNGFAGFLVKSFNYLSTERTIQNTCDRFKEWIKGDNVDPRVDHYKEILENITEAKAGETLESFALRRYGPYGEKALSILAGLHPSYRELIVDPGLVFHLEEFSQFISKKDGRNPKTKDPWQAREEFKHALGYETYYRSLALNEEELAVIKEKGMLSHGLRLNSRERNQELFGKSLQEQYENRVNNVREPTEDQLLSVSKFPSIGNFLAYQYIMDNALGSDKKVYQFRVRLPRLDLFYPTKEGEIVQSDHPYSSAVESFVPLFIAPSEIKNVGKSTPFERNQWKYYLSLYAQQRIWDRMNLQ